MPASLEPDRRARVLMECCCRQAEISALAKKVDGAHRLTEGMKRGARRPVDSRMISPRGTGVAVLNVIYACRANCAIKQCFRIDPRCFWWQVQGTDRHPPSRC